MGESTFQGEVAAALQRLRMGLVRVLAAVEDGRNSARLAERLGIDATLAWRVIKLVEVPDPFAAGQYLPGDAAMARFTRAAAKLGVVEGVVEGIEGALAELADLRARHAGDRQSFALMMNAFAGEDRQRVALEARRDLFRAASAVWGVRVHATHHTYLIHPSERPGVFEVIVLVTHEGVQRLAPDVPWRLVQMQQRDEEGARRGEPLDPTVNPDDALPLLTEFCTGALPEFLPQARAGGVVEYRLAGGDVGRRSAFTVVLAERFREGVTLEQLRASPLWFAAQVRSPMEVFTLDVALPGGIDLGPASFGGYHELYSSNDPDAPSELERAELFEDQETVRGIPPGLVAAPELPRYGEMLATVYERAGWKPEPVTLHRATVRYPPVPVMARMSWELPKTL